MHIYKTLTSSAAVEGAMHTTYGIEAVGEDGEVLARVEYVSADREAVESLAERCQRLGLAEYQLIDVARDFAVAEACYTPPKTVYRVCTSTVEIDKVARTTYGIEAVGENGEVIARIEDISADKNAVERLAERCQRLGLAAYQLIDVARDFAAAEECYTPPITVYRVCASAVEIDKVARATYGIEAVGEDGEVIARIEDISADRDAVEKLAEMCQRNGLAPYQLIDVARDFAVAEACYTPPKTVYRVCASAVEIDEVARTTYGIEAVREEGEVLAKVRDISADRDAVERLAEKCQRLGLATYQLIDVARDFATAEACYTPQKPVYRVCASTVEIDKVTRTTYGIEAVGEDGEVLAKVEDISTDRGAVERLAERCQRLGLAEYQLIDVARDFAVESQPHVKRGV